MAYRLTLRAEADLKHIFARGDQEYGRAAAVYYRDGLIRTIELLERFPRMARERIEISDPVRIHPYRAHLIIYEIIGPDILVIRIRHGMEDWRPLPD